MAISQDERRIRYEIQQHIRGSKGWTIGVTQDPEYERSQLNARGLSTNRWRAWSTPSPPVAYRIRTFFKKQNLSTSHGIYGQHVYVY